MERRISIAMVAMGLTACTSAATSDRIDEGRREQALCPVGQVCGGNHDIVVAYYGGNVISQPHVVQVLYGPGTYMPEIARQSAPSMTSFYKQLFATGVYDWLANDYNVGRGRFMQWVLINPSVDGPTVTDHQITDELAYQISQGRLPGPDGHTVYMIHFPQGTTIPEAAGDCGYHSAVQSAYGTLFYAVLPDITTQPAGTCGTRPAVFDNQTAVAAHELSEIMTDAGGTPNPGWVDNFFGREGEIADLCQNQEASGIIPTHEFGFHGFDGHTYVASHLWALAGNTIPAHACKTHPRSPQDVLWHYVDGTTSIYFDANVVKPTGALGVVDPAWHVAGVGDFDGDGFDDIAWLGPGLLFGTQRVSIWWKGVAANATVTATSASQSLLGIGDFDYDGRSDILWRVTSGANAGQVSIWYGGSANQSISNGIVSTAGTTASVGDFDGDGASDILWRTATATSDTYTIWRGGSPPTIRQPPLNGPGASFVLAAVGDFDGDGQSDLYFRSSTSGQVVIWYSASSARTLQVGTLDTTISILGAGLFTPNSATSDVYVRHQSNGQLQILRNGGLSDTVNAGFITDPQWQVVGVGSFDF